MDQEKGIRSAPQVVIDEAHTLRKSLIQCVFPERGELLESLQKLRYTSMSLNRGGAYDVSRTVDHFYEAVCWNDRLKLDLTDTYEDIANYLVDQTPAILAILPAGQIGTNVYDPTARRFLNIMS